MTMFMDGTRADFDEAGRAAADEQLCFEIAMVEPTRDGVRQAIGILGLEGIQNGLQPVLGADTTQVIGLNAKHRPDRKAMEVTVVRRTGLSEAHTYYFVDNEHRPNLLIGAEGTNAGQFDEKLITLLGKLAEANNNPHQRVDMVHLPR
jgi:hypothetical protein